MGTHSVFPSQDYLTVKGMDSFEKYLSLGSLDPEPGSYTFQFLAKNKEVLFENEISFSGQNVLIEDIGKLHHPSKTAVTEEYFLDNVKITVTNNWNFKIEAGLDVTVGKEFYWSSKKSHLIQPGQSKEIIFKLDAPITETIEPGSYNVRYEVVASRYEWAEGGTVARRFENIKFYP